MSLKFTLFSTYKHPTKNLDKIKRNVFVMNPEKKEQQNVRNDANNITFLLPIVSARNPQKYAVTTMPQNGIDENSPSSVVVKFKSQFAYGNTKLALIFSIVAPNITDPENRKIIM